MKKTNKPEIRKGRFFKVYFESLYESTAGKSAQELMDRVTYCTVIADTTREAIDKAEAAFPGERVNSASCEDPHRYGLENAARPTGEWIVL